jgi:hypothetical protein
VTVTTTATLDGVRNVDSVTDPAGRVTSAAYDADERMCWSFQGSATSSCSSPPATWTTRPYNANTSDPLIVEYPRIQPVELTCQPRGECGARQIDVARVAPSHTVGPRAQRWRRHPDHVARLGPYSFRG